MWGSRAAGRSKRRRAAGGAVMRSRFWRGCAEGSLAFAKCVRATRSCVCGAHSAGAVTHARTHIRGRACARARTLTRHAPRARSQPHDWARCGGTDACSAADDDDDSDGDDDDGDGDVMMAMSMVMVMMVMAVTLMWSFRRNAHRL
eukprot:6199567-Pleurochrysis_carterae.AAC.1